MERVIEKEWLDELPAEHAHALRSRKDLRRLNAWMGHPRFLAQTLQRELASYLSGRILELGASDGDFMLRVARRLRSQWRHVDVSLLDRHDLVPAATGTRFAAMNWRVRTVCDDVFHWLEHSPRERFDAIVVNLFLHHFTPAQIRTLFAAVTERTGMFIALEPRRDQRSLFFSRLVFAIGCGAVTRHDAPTSVRAGFGGRELTALWPDAVNWELTEGPAGWFSHSFIARRKRERVDPDLFQPSVATVFDHSGNGNGSTLDARERNAGLRPGALSNNGGNTPGPEAGAPAREQSAPSENS